MKKVIVIMLCALLLVSVYACGSDENGGADNYSGETTLPNILASLRSRGMTSWWDILAVYNAGHNPLDGNYGNFDEILDALEAGESMTDRAAYVLVTNISVVIGADPEYFEEYENFKSILKELLENPGENNLNDYIYAYLALKTADVEFNETPIRAFAEAAQLPDGGFAFWGEESDIDSTAMMIPALIIMGSDAARDRATAFLRNNMNEDGTFSSWGTANANSTASALSALTAAYGTDNETVQKARDGLSLFETGGGYSWELGGERNDFATSQGAVALGDLQNGTNAWLKLYHEWRHVFEDLDY